MSQTKAADGRESDSSLRLHPSSFTLQPVRSAIRDFPPPGLFDAKTCRRPRPDECPPRSDHCLYHLDHRDRVLRWILHKYAYGRSIDDLKYIWGFPDWVFYGIIVPWGACIAFSWLFASIWMRDEDLGEDPPGTEAIGEFGQGG